MKFEPKVSNRRSRLKNALLLAFVAAISGGGAVLGQTGEPSAVAPASQPARISDSFAEVARKVGPAVVSIEAKARPRDLSSRNRTAPADPDDIFELFGRQMRQRPVTAVGSGFIVDPAGYIITNGHVVENSARVTVKIDSGEEFQANVIGTDRETDVAVLKIDAGRALPFVKFGDSDLARVGDWVLAIGSPFGLNRSVTAGIISHVKRETPMASPFQRFIQTDAAINRGNSGGPLVNLDGEVIGVNSQIATSTGDYNGVGFALPSSEAVTVYQQIRASGKVRRGYLGVLLDSVRAEFAKVYGLNDERGAIVTDVQDNDGPAASAGLKAGDIIVEFDGKPVASAMDLISKVATTAPDRSVNIAYLRENGTGIDRRTVSMRLGERPDRGGRSGQDESPVRLPLDRAKEEPKPFGLTLSELTPDLASTLKLEGQGGLVVKEISPESFIADVKMSSGAEALGQGDIIMRINRKPVTNAATFAAIVGELKKGDAVVLHVLTPVLGSRSTVLKIVQFTVQ